MHGGTAPPHGSRLYILSMMKDEGLSSSLLIKHLLNLSSPPRHTPAAPLQDWQLILKPNTALLTGVHLLLLQPYKPLPGSARYADPFLLFCDYVFK